MFLQRTSLREAEHPSLTAQFEVALQLAVRQVGKEGFTPAASVQIKSCLLKHLSLLPNWKLPFNWW
jgi:hypothetical protein